MEQKHYGYCEACGEELNHHGECKAYTTTCPQDRVLECVFCKSGSVVEGNGESEVLECDTCFRQYTFNHDTESLEHVDRKEVEDIDIDHVLSLLEDEGDGMSERRKSIMRQYKDVVLRYYVEVLGGSIQNENISIKN